MRHEACPTTVSVLAASWLAAVPAFATTLVAAAAGQGLGAMAGGCGWIGVSLPIHRPVWALVNQPTLNFASTAGAVGYWLGSLAAPMVFAVLIFSLRSRKPTLAGQLFVVQCLWWTAVVACTWLPLLDPVDGHLSRWLALNRWPEWVVWAAPAGALVVAMLAVFRLLEISRSLRRGAGRAARIGLVVGHLLVPTSAWLGVVTLVGGPVSWRPLVGLMTLAATVVAAAWFRYPPPYPRQPVRLTAVGVVGFATGIAISGAVLWWGGRALDGDRVSGVLWAAPGSFNNVRPWIAPNRGSAEAPPER